MKNLRIKKYVCGTFLASALLMVGCQTDEAVDEWGEPGQQPGDAGDVTLLLSVAGELATRTILPGSENVQHVTYVQQMKMLCVSLLRILVGRPTLAIIRPQ